MANEDSGLVKRGLGLLLLMTVLVVVLLTIILQRNAPQASRAPTWPEAHVLSMVRVEAPFPGSISWAGLFQVGEVLPSAPGWEIRYNASQALARLGAKDVPWDVLREMLDEEQQLRNFRARLNDGSDVPDEAAARGTVLSALRAVSEWHKKQNAKPAAPPAGLPEVYAAVDLLAQNPIVEIKSQAEYTRALFIK